MSVNEIAIAQIFVGDGSNQDYVFPDYIDNIDDIKVTLSDVVAHTIQDLHHITNWTTPTVSDDFGSYPDGLILHFLVPPPSAIIITIFRKTTQTQKTEYVDNNPFTAGSLNHALDKLTVMIQDNIIQRYKGVAFSPPTDIDKAYHIGDFFLNEIPAPGGFFGWVCTTAGLPGTWKGFGIVES